MEKTFEEKLGIWQKMTSKMALKQHLQADAAYKVATSHISVITVLCMNRLYCLVVKEILYLRIPLKS